MVTECQAPSSGITRPDKLPGGPCTSSLGVGQAELAAAGLKCPLLYDGMDACVCAQSSGTAGMQIPWPEAGVELWVPSVL